MSKRKTVKCKSGLDGWQNRLQGEYSCFQEFLEADELYGLAARLGFASAREAWGVDPLVQGSVIPDDYCRVFESHELPLHVKVVVELQIDMDSIDTTKPVPEWQIRQGAKQAVRNAIEFARDNGFSHDYADDLSIGLVDVETAGNDLTV